MFRNSYCQVSHSLANVINVTRTISFVNNFGSVNVFVFVVKKAFDSPCLPLDYKDEIEISELVEFSLLVFTYISVIFYSQKIKAILRAQRSPLILKSVNMAIDSCFRAGIIELRSTWEVLRARKRESWSRGSHQPLLFLDSSPNFPSAA